MAAPSLNGFLSWADKRNIISVRSATLYITVWMTWRITEWAFALAKAWIGTGTSGIEVAAVIGAITLPFCTMQAAIFKKYVESM